MRIIPFFASNKKPSYMLGFPIQSLVRAENGMR